MGQFLFIIIIIFIFQGVLTLVQLRDFKQNADELRKIGRVGSGISSKTFTSTMILLAADENGIVVDGRIMEGSALTAKFKPFGEYNARGLGNIIKDIEEKLSSTANIAQRNRLIAALKAAIFLKKSFKDNDIQNDSSFDGVSSEEIIDSEITQDSVEIKEEYDEFENTVVEKPPIVDVDEFEQM